MIFTTFHFLLFFLVVFPLFFVLRRSWRQPMLLAASYYFYMCAIPWYITVIIAITIVDFIAGILIERARSPGGRKGWLAISLVTNFGILIAFKYAGFFAVNTNEIFGTDLPVLQWVLPLGISFHTFQAVSYTIEVYRGTVPAERNLLRYALYVAFFPQMVAGPIERPYNLLNQFHMEQRLDYERFRSGLLIALWGFFKKICVADLIAPAVTSVFNQPEQASGPVLLVAIFFFTIQVYCDFSGYSDIAIGVARMMGFDLMINFRQPYFSRTIADFWRRWHISLSTWFRDYLYYPLGGSRVSVPRHYFNIMLVFLLSGLWHGASWNCAIWGALHGFYIVFGSITAGFRARIRSFLGISPDNPALVVLQVLTTFSLHAFALAFFRSLNIHDALHIVTHLHDWSGFRISSLFTLGLPRFEMVTAFPLIAVIFIVEYFMIRPPSWFGRLWSRRWFRWVCYFSCLYAIIFFGVFRRVEFIYFQF